MVSGHQQHEPRSARPGVARHAGGQLGCGAGDCRRGVPTAQTDCRRTCPRRHGGVGPVQTGQADDQAGPSWSSPGGRRDPRRSTKRRRLPIGARSRRDHARGDRLPASYRSRRRESCGSYRFSSVPVVSSSALTFRSMWPGEPRWGFRWAASPTWHSTSPPVSPSGTGALPATVSRRPRCTARSRRVSVAYPRCSLLRAARLRALPTAERGPPSESHRAACRRG